MDDAVDLRTLKYKVSSDSDEEIEEEYYKEPFKFLWAHSGEMAVEKNTLIFNSERLEKTEELDRGKKVLYFRILSTSDISTYTELQHKCTPGRHTSKNAISIILSQNSSSHEMSKPFFVTDK